jgi:polysaccharide deacetylase 2 family uncharacterized protein YibQ
MAFDGMATPLGLAPEQRQRGVAPGWRWGFAGLLIIGLALVFIVSGTLRRGEGSPAGMAALIVRAESVTPRSAASAPIDRGEAEGDRPSRSGTAAIEAESGVKVVRQNGGQSPGGVVIKVPGGMSSAAAGDAATGGDPRVGEPSRLGILPRIGEGGVLPRQVYARAFAPTEKPMIAIVLTGVGIGARGTAEAISKLPGAVTFAFAPYGRDLPSQVARARRDGHEILLQVPMEPRDYPESDPGPHTLRSNVDNKENIERLHWLMSRFTGYIGLTNFMGDKLMRADKSYAALLEEINRRGLLFLDDGLSEGSGTKPLAGKIGLPVGVADRVHEAGAGKSLDTQLDEIEMLARKKGSAILTVPALPANIDKIAVWERGLAARGLVLAPLSAIIHK